MTAKLNLPRLAAALLAGVLSAGAAPAQQVVYEWIATDPVDDWNENANWDGNGLNFVPDATLAAGESARINNGNTALVNNLAVPLIAGLNVNNGAVEIQGTGTVQTVASGSANGFLTLGGAGTINLSGSGELIVAGPAINSGTLRLIGPNPSVQLAGTFDNTFGTVAANITDPSNHGTINVAGEATLGGTLLVNMSGFNPTFGQSWDIVTAGTLTGGFANVVVQSTPRLDRGLQIQTGNSGNRAIVEVGNALVLTVNRQSGTTTIQNVVGNPITITSYAVRSANGLLSENNWNPLSVSNLAGPGWVDANPTNNNLAELNLENSHSILLNQSLAIGNAYGGSTALAAEEDVIFQYSTLDGEFRQGIVEYEGLPNDLTLFVDPTSGAASIGNLSPHITPPTVTSYAVRSAEGQLIEGNWDSFATTGEAGAGWEEANPTSAALAELNLEGSTPFTNGTLLSLGDIFTPGGVRDLVLQYTTVAGDEVLTGSILYGALPASPGGVPGDYNGDGTVNAADYTVWRDSLGANVPQGTGADGTGDGTVNAADYDFWRERFGNTAGSGSGATASNVPEPASALLALAALLAAAVYRRGRKK